MNVGILAGTFSQDVELEIRPIALGNLRDVVGEFSTLGLTPIIELRVNPPLNFQQPVSLVFVATPPGDISRVCKYTSYFLIS